MKTKQTKGSVESIMVMLLMIAFSISIAMVIMQGSNLFKQIISNRESDENLRIAMSYVNMRVKQNDSSDRVYVLENAVGEREALVLEHLDMEEGYFSYIYYDNGYLYECYTNELPTKEMSTPLIEVDDVTFKNSPENNQILVNYTYTRSNKKHMQMQIITLRTN